MALRINVGDRVRSFDFADHHGKGFGRDLKGERASYVEGTVLEITDKYGENQSFDCPRYRIRVEKDVSGGVVRTDEHSRIGIDVFPPLNGTPTILGGHMNGVERIK